MGFIIRLGLGIAVLIILNKTASMRTQRSPAAIFPSGEGEHRSFRYFRWISSVVGFVATIATLATLVFTNEQLAVAKQQSDAMQTQAQPQFMVKDDVVEYGVPPDHPFPRFKTQSTISVTMSGVARDIQVTPLTALIPSGAPTEIQSDTPSDVVPAPAYWLHLPADTPTVASYGASIDLLADISDPIFTIVRIDYVDMFGVSRRQYIKLPPSWAEFGTVDSSGVQSMPASTGDACARLLGLGDVSVTRFGDGKSTPLTLPNYGRPYEESDLKAFIHHVSYQDLASCVYFGGTGLL